MVPYGAPGCDETAVNLSSFQNFKSSLYRSRLQRFPTLPQIREEIEFRGEWTQTARDEDFLLVDTGRNDQNRLVPFATVGNIEKFCEAETIYIDRTFKASPKLFISSSQYMLCIMASTSVTQSIASQHLVHIDSIILKKMYFINSHFVNFPLCQFPLCQH